MGTIVRLTLALAVLVLVGATTQFSGATFSATTQNPANSFQAAASFGGFRVATGSYAGNKTDDRQITGVGFEPDVVIIKADGNRAAELRSATMTGDASKSLAGAAALRADRIQSLDADGFTIGGNNQVNANNTDFYWIAFKAGASSMQLGTYVGDGTTSHSITGLGFQPELVTVLSAAANPAVLRTGGMVRGFRFDTGTGLNNSIASLDADGFSVAQDGSTNANGTTYHYLAWNATPGKVAVANYTGNATAGRSITGAGFQPDYVLVRANDTATSRRGLQRPAALGGATSLFFSGTNSVTNGITALEPNGFQVGANTNANANGVDYAYAAFKDSP